MDEERDKLIFVDMKNKNGQVSAMPNNIIGLGVAAIVLILMLVIVANLNDTDIVSKTNSGSAVNESVLTVNQAGDVLTAGANPACKASIGLVTNRTSGTVIAAGNYSVTGCKLYAANDVSGGFNNSGWNVTYDYTYGDKAFLAGNASVIGLATFGDFWVIIVLAIVAAIVIGIIFGVFGKQKR